MRWQECKELIRKDYVQLTGDTHIDAFGFFCGSIKKLITNASYKITFWFRVGSYLKSKRRLYYKPLLWVVMIIYRRNQYKTGCQLYLGTNIGGGLVFPHYGCQIIHYGAVLGENVQIYQGVTIGSVRGKKGLPIIGNNVVLFSGAKIIGGVTIGDNCAVGAGAVVIKDVPSGCVVAGVPAKIVSQKGEEIISHYIHK